VANKLRKTAEKEFKNMEQKELRETEDKCIQEQPAYCVAACPIHVDVRTLIWQIKQGKWEDARKTLNKTMPFAGILGRICDHPCENHCKRREAGDPVAISALERCCVQKVSLLPKISFLPSKTQKIAILSGGLRSLTAAWDLIRKGYKIHIFTEQNRLGESLWDLPESLLPKEVIEKEFSVLEKLGAQIHLNAEKDMGFFKANPGSKEFDAVYAPPENERFLAPLEMTWLVSPINEALEGRKAAVTIDRQIQKVSLTAGREKEGPYKTRLFTSIENIAPLPLTPMSHPESGYTPEEAIQEAERCLQCQCLECVKACLYLEHFKGYPKKYAREIYNNESIVMGERKGNTLVNSCSLCGLCEVICPNDFSMADVCRNARTSMVKRGKMPPSAHEFALRDMAFSNGEKFALSKHEPGHEKSEYLFFPGCQLSASSPGHVETVYDFLRSHLKGGVGLMLRCCGAPADWAAREEIFQAGLETLEAQWEALGRPKMILVCSTCYSIFKRSLSHINIISLWEILEKYYAFSLSDADKGCLALHDPCTTRHEPQIRETVRSLLKNAGYKIEELKYSGEQTTCCGYGGLMSNANPALAKAVIQRRAEESESDFVAYCAMCRDALSSAGKRTLHLLDILFPSDDADPASQKPPTYSQRHENRARLKEHLCQILWKENVSDMADHEDLMLNIAPEVEKQMDERRILKSDIQKVIRYAEESGNRFYNSKTGHWLAAYQPVNVTYWAEYSVSDSVFVIHNAYCHRMTIAEGKR
jgi:Fe-S oxidoreductase